MTIIVGRPLKPNDENLLYFEAHKGHFVSNIKHISRKSNLHSSCKAQHLPAYNIGNFCLLVTSA